MEKNYSKILDEIVENKGIEFIKEYLGQYNKIQRRKQINVNKYDDVAKDVYDLMYNQNYSNKKAMDKVADDRNITFYAVRNHYNKLNRQARAFDFFSFGALIDELIPYYGDGDYYNNNYEQAEYELNELAKENYITYQVAQVYYNKYKHSNLKKRPTVDYKKFKVPKSLQPKQMPYQTPNYSNDDELPF